MKNVQLNSRYFSRTKDFYSTRNPEINYNETIINPNESYRQTETAGFEFPSCGFSNVSATEI